MNLPGELAQQPEPSQRVEAAKKLFHLGLMEEALTACQEIVAAERGNAEAWNLLGLVFFHLGATDQSIRAFETAADAAPRAPEALNNLGNLYKQTGDTTKAIRCYRKALALAPHLATTHANIAACLLEAENVELAESHAREALAADPLLPNGYAALATVYEKKGDFTGATRILRDGLSRLPQDTDLIVQMGCAHMMGKQHEPALQAFDAALALRPKLPEAWVNKGFALFELGRLDEAENALSTALDMKPDMPGALINLANVLISQRNHPKALSVLERLLTLDPHHPSAHFLRSLVLLVEGDYENGWAEYDWRLLTPELRLYADAADTPRWTGTEDIAGKTLLVHAEQGIGDTLQFVRYLPLLRERGARIVLEAQPQLRRLLAGTDGIDKFIAKGDALPPSDLHVPLLSLPRLLWKTQGAHAQAVPYVRADEGAVAAWRERVDSLGPGLKVGIAWAGNPDHANDRNRSMRFGQLRPLLALDHVKWISLQKNRGAGDSPEEIASSGLTDWTSDLTDYAETAGLIESLDLIVSVDTSVAHLAGAMNKPVWVMIPFAPDWRWLLERTDSPWYPGLRLFRQGEYGDWSGVIDAIGQALEHPVPKQ